uniref:Uncharacterized protein n=1 Tax=Anguilla anguilla TaxID=7936 RepID=A0A0E9UFF5_ANGAN
MYIIIIISCAWRLGMGSHLVAGKSCDTLFLGHQGKGI